jgi:hypothetical protein
VNEPTTVSVNLPPYTIRPAERGDRGYIIDTWLQSYRSSPFAQKLPDFAYWSRFGHVGLVESIMDNPDTRIKVACLPDGGSWLYGWICSNLVGLVHYVFVRNEFRRLGSGSGFGGFGVELLRAAGVDNYDPLGVTHLTPDFSRRLGRRSQIRFINPYRGDKE